MIRSVAVVHDDPEFLVAAAAALRAAGCQVTTYTGSMAALNGIEAAGDVDVLVTRITFPPRAPNGVSLALVLRAKFPKLKIVFTDGILKRHVAGIGEQFSHPVDLGKLARAVVGEAFADSPEIRRLGSGRLVE